MENSNIADKQERLELLRVRFEQERNRLKELITNNFKKEDQREVYLERLERLIYNQEKSLKEALRVKDNKELSKLMKESMSIENSLVYEVNSFIKILFSSSDIWKTIDEFNGLKLEIIGEESFVSQFWSELSDCDFEKRVELPIWQ